MKIQAGHVLEKSNDAADKVIRYTLQQTLEGNASAKSNFNYQGLDSTKRTWATFRNAFLFSLNTIFQAR
jgi:hypothetical protein